MQLVAHRNARKACPSVSSWAAYRAAGKQEAHVWRAGQARAHQCAQPRPPRRRHLFAQDRRTRRPASASRQRPRELLRRQPSVAHAPLARLRRGAKRGVPTTGTAQPSEVIGAAARGATLSMPQLDNYSAPCYTTIEDGEHYHFTVDIRAFTRAHRPTFLYPCTLDKRRGRGSSRLGHTRRRIIAMNTRSLCMNRHSAREVSAVVSCLQACARVYWSSLMAAYT